MATSKDDMIWRVESGASPDIHLQLFDQGFRVHSSVLGKHSKFFANSFGHGWFPFQATEASRKPSGKSFWQLYITRVKDGIGFLEYEYTRKMAKESDPEREDTPDDDTPVENAKEQIEAFKTFLWAMYGCQISIDSQTQLALLTKQADYYKCLPFFSGAVTEAFPYSPKLVHPNMAENTNVLEAAKRLRIGVLFKECIIHLTGHWETPQHRNLSDPELKLIAENTYQSIQAKLSVFKQYYKRTPPSSWLKHAWEEYGQNMEKLKEPLPVVYRSWYSTANEEEVKSLLEPILRNNLKLDQNGTKAGENEYAELFLCAEIEDGDLPWDPNEKDW